MEEIGLFEAIYSLPQITRYKSDPVPREVIEKIIDAATKAPNGANTQPWEFIVITDRDLVTKVGQLYRDAWFESQGTTPPPNEPPAHRAARYLAHTLEPGQGLGWQHRWKQARMPPSGHCPKDVIGRIEDGSDRCGPPPSSMGAAGPGLPRALAFPRP